MSKDVVREAVKEALDSMSVEYYVEEESGAVVVPVISEKLENNLLIVFDIFEDYFMLLGIIPIQVDPEDEDEMIRFVNMVNQDIRYGRFVYDEEEMDVQYRISDPVKYLYSVVNPDNTLLEATDSALRYVVGHTLMDDILTSGRELVRQATRELLTSIIEPYNTGLTIVDVNFLPARAPEQVKEAFDDAIAAQEDEQRYKREAEAYANEVLPKAEGQVQRIRQEAEGYRSQVVLKAEGEVARFEKVLPEYNAAPDITKTRIYLETMQEVLGKSQKILLDTPKGSSPVLYLPLPQNAMQQLPQKPKAQEDSASVNSKDLSDNKETLSVTESYPPLTGNSQNSYGTSSRRGR